MTEKKEVHVRLKPEHVKWVDEKIKENVWLNRGHAFDRLVMMGKAREARGEDLSIIEFPDGFNIDLDLKVENIDWLTNEAERQGKTTDEILNEVIRQAKDSGKFD